MKIISIAREKINPKIWKWENDYYWVTSWWWNGMFWYFIHQKSLDWENWILETLAWIKNVAVTKEEYEKLKKEHQEIMDNDYEWYEWDFPLCFDLENAYDNSIFTKEQLSQTYYTWSGWEMGWAESYSDITVCFDNFSDREEYYKTSEVLEVLEKWKEALERWNNPEEKKKMIEEFEKGEKKED